MNAALLDDLTGERNVVLGCLAMGMAEVKERSTPSTKASSTSPASGISSTAMQHVLLGMGSRLRFAIAAAKDYESC